VWFVRVPPGRGVCDVMPWVKLDDGLHGHPKAAKAGLEALGLHMLALTHCSAYLTDGRVSAEFVIGKALKRSEALAGRLVDAGLWELNCDGWVIHDYLIYNPSREKVLAKRAAESERKAAGR
jgi:hypothetical protein